MKRSYPSRMIAAILVAALMLGLVPTTALAAKDDEITSIVQYKGMSMVNLAGGNWVARYEYADAANSFYTFNAVDLQPGHSWVRLAYTIEKSQYVDLQLYKLDTEAAKIDRAPWSPR